MTKLLETDFFPRFQSFVNDVRENLAPRYKSAEALVDGHKLKLRIVEKKLFFPRIWIVCFSHATITGSELAKFERWRWEEYEEKHERNQLLKYISVGGLKAEEVLAHYIENSFEYKSYTRAYDG